MNASFWLSLIGAITTAANFVIMLQVRLALQTMKTEMATQRSEDRELMVLKIEQSRHNLRNEVQVLFGTVTERLRDVELALASYGHYPKDNSR